MDIVLLDDFAKRLSEDGEVVHPDSIGAYALNDTMVLAVDIGGAGDSTSSGLPLNDISVLGDFVMAHAITADT